MAPNDIINILPNPNNINYEQIKKEHPYNILLKFAHAITEKYPGKLEGIITESSDITQAKLLTYAFYLLAPIGKGYSYRLLELEPTNGEMYPLRILIFETNTQELAIVNSGDSLEKTLQDVFKMGFTQTLILNLLSQVDLYNENRNGNYTSRIKRTFYLDGNIIDDKLANENKQRLKLLLTSFEAGELQKLLFYCTPIYETTIMHTTQEGNIEIEPSPNFNVVKFNSGLQNIPRTSSCSIKICS